MVLGGGIKSFTAVKLKSIRPASLFQNVKAPLKCIKRRMSVWYLKMAWRPIRTKPSATPIFDTWIPLRNVKIALEPSTNYPWGSPGSCLPRRIPDTCAVSVEKNRNVNMFYNSLNKFSKIMMKGPLRPVILDMYNGLVSNRRLSKHE